MPTFVLWPTVTVTVAAIIWWLFQPQFRTLKGRGGVYYRAIYVRVPGYTRYVSVEEGIVYIQEFVQDDLVALGEQLAVSVPEDQHYNSEYFTAVALISMGLWPGYTPEWMLNGHWILQRPEKIEKTFTLKARQWNVYCRLSPNVRATFDAEVRALIGSPA